MEKNQKWLNKFIADSRAREHASDSMAVEEAMFSVFTDTISSSEVLPNIFFQKYSGNFHSRQYEVWGFHKSLDDNILEYSVFVCDFNFSEQIIDAQKRDVDNSIKRVSNFLKFTLSGSLRGGINDFHDISETIDDIIDSESKYGIDSINIYFLTNKQLKKVDNLQETISFKSIEVNVRIHYWDLTRWGEVVSSNSKREPISFEFKNLSYKVKMITLPNNINDLKTHVGIVPTQLLYDLYSAYNVRLLENNVRVNLKTKKNMNMGRTLIDEPEMFVSYNNGLSATCKELQLDKDGYAHYIDDFQIVNGGQTTATIYYTKTNRKTRDNCDLSKSYVQIKITEVPNKNHHEKLVPKISEFSNTQNAVKSSDFYATNPLLIFAEKFTKQHYVRPKESKQNIFYFLERMGGQYNEELKRQGNPGTRARKEFEIKYPKALKFDKLDLARWANLINDLPHEANDGKEKSFKVFINSTKTLKPTPFWIQSVMGAGEVFKYVRKLYGYANRKTTPLFLGNQTDQTLGQSISIFVVSYLDFSSNGLFSFHKFYDFSIEIRVIENILKELMETIYHTVLKKGGASAQEQSKKIPMWEFLKKDIKFDNSKLNPFLISVKEKKRLMELKEQSQIEFFNLANNYLQNGAKELVALNSFFKTTLNINYTDKKALERIFKRVISLKMTLKLSDFEFIKDLIQKANEIGFKNTRRDVGIDEYEIFSLSEKIIAIEELLNKDDKELSTKFRDVIESYKISKQLNGEQLIFLANNL